MRFKALPVTSFEDVTVDLEQMQTLLKAPGAQLPFLQLTTPKQWTVDGGNATITFSGSTSSGTRVVNHGIGRLPFSVTITSFNAPTFACVTAADASTITVQAFDPFGVRTSTDTFYWVAIG